MFTILKKLYDDWNDRRDKRKRWADRNVRLTHHALERFLQDTQSLNPKAPTKKQKVKNIFLESDYVGEFKENTYFANKYGIFVKKRGAVVTFIGVKRMDDESYVGMYHKYQKEMI